MTEASPTYKSVDPPFRAMIAIVLLLLLTAGAVGAALHRTWRVDDAARATGARPDSRSVEFRVDVNTAGEREIAALPGVGPKLAERIVNFRKANGPFRTVDDLDRVSGIGPAILASVRPFLVVRDGSADMAANVWQSIAPSTAD